MEIKTREDVENFLLELTRNLIPCFTEDHAYMFIKGGGAAYDQRTIGFEGFCRPLWGLVPFWRSGGRCPDLEEIYIDGIRNGSDSDKDCYWGHSHDNDQKFVEMGALAYAIMATPEKVWNPLTDKEKENLASFLYEINDHTMPVCNWYWFRILVNLALKSVGMPYNQSQIESDHALIESWYLGSGCWVDGSSLRIDYYVPFAMHLYPMLAATLTGFNKEATYERASVFYNYYRYLFASDGSAVPYGRSMTYRFAVCGYFSMLALEEKDEKRLSVMKGIVMRCLRYWNSTDMLTDEGALSVGYEYPNLTMAERYNSPTSPYWAFKAFSCLLMDKDHPFWKVEEAENTITEPLVSYREAAAIFENRGWNALIYPACAKQKNDLGHFSSKYGKFAYSTAFPFSVSHTFENLQDAAPDSALAFRFPNGRIAVRSVSLEYEVQDDRIISIWQPDERIKVKSEIIPTGNGHIRRHEIESETDVDAIDSGFALPKWEAEKEIEDHKAVIKAEGLVSRVEGEGEAIIFDAAPNTNMKWRNTVIPAIVYHISKGNSIIETVIITSCKKEDA